MNADQVVERTPIDTISEPTVTHTGDAATDALPPSAPAVMAPSAGDENAELLRQLAETTARAERAEERNRMLVVTTGHRGRTGKTKPVALPWEQPGYAAATALPMIQALVSLGRRAVQHTGLIDNGPLPDGWHRQSQDGGVSCLDLHIERHLENGIERTAKFIADKMHARVFTIREHLVAAAEMMIFLVILDRHHGDEVLAKKEFLALDRLPVYDLTITNESEAAS